MHDLANKYFESLNLKDNNFPKPFMIGFIGLTGSGKTTIINRLAKVFDIPIISSDHIRRFLNKQGMVGESPDQKLLNDIAVYVVETLCQKKISYLIDADLILAEYNKQIFDRAERYDYNFYLIRVICDEQIILHRIKDRQNNPNSLSKAGTKMYWQRKKIHAEQKLPKNIIYTIDTSSDHEKQFQELVEKIKLSIK